MEGVCCFSVFKWDIFKIIDSQGNKSLTLRIMKSEGAQNFHWLVLWWVHIIVNFPLHSFEVIPP